MAIYINDLVEHGEYLDYKQSWLVCLSKQGNYLLGDKEVTVSYNKTQFFIEPDTVVQKIIRHPKLIVEYVNGDVIYTLDKYNSIRDRYKNEDWEYEYPSLEEEFEHRKELEALKDFTPVYEQKETEYEPVELKCVGSVEDTGNKYISTAISYGQKGFGNSGFYKVNYTAMISDTFWKFVDDNNLRESTTNDFSRDYVRFAKIRGNYVVGDKIVGAEEGQYKYHHDLSVAKQQLDSAQKDFMRHLKVKVFGSEVGVNKKTLSQVLADLENISSLVNNLDCKQKSYNSKRILLGKLSKLIGEYKLLVDDEI